MSTLPIRAPHIAETRWPLPGLAQFVSGLKSALDLLAEVDRLVGEARERYPFAD